MRESGKTGWTWRGALRLLAGASGTLTGMLAVVLLLDWSGLPGPGAIPADAARFLGALALFAAALSALLLLAASWPGEVRPRPRGPGGGEPVPLDRRASGRARRAA
ncbi:MAG TPA: hypothetical protein VFW66_09160 [Gemmatimonadales bacterium]|nr:hypothetical protein [Gemmatimonadales bacterium]